MFSGCKVSSLNGFIQWFICKLQITLTSGSEGKAVLNFMGYRQGFCCTITSCHGLNWDCIVLCLHAEDPFLLWAVYRYFFCGLIDCNSDISIRASDWLEEALFEIPAVVANFLKPHLVCLARIIESSDWFDWQYDGVVFAESSIYWLVQWCAQTSRLFATCAQLSRQSARWPSWSWL